jgi:rod shape-determining protein MreD
MIYFIYIAVCLAMIILQTSVMPYLPLFDHFYDLIALVVIYLGLYRSVRESIFLIVFVSVLMDTLSGGPFGLYLATYGWIYIGVVWMRRFMRVGNQLLLPAVMAAGILIQNIISIGTVTILIPQTQMPTTVFRTVATQILWAVVTGPLLLTLFNYAHQRWDHWTAELFADRNGLS